MSEHRPITNRLTLALAVGALGVACSFLTPAASAQEQSRTQNQTEHPSVARPSPSPTIPDEKLDAAAAAIEHVSTIKENYQQRLAAAPPSDHERIAGEATAALKKAITDQGLSVEEYNSIVETALNDPTVRQQLVGRIHATGNGR